MTEIQNPKLLSNIPLCGSSVQDFVLVIEYWNLRFICILVLVIWDFISIGRNPRFSPGLKKNQLFCVWIN